MTPVLRINIEQPTRQAVRRRGKRICMDRPYGGQDDPLDSPRSVARVGSPANKGRKSAPEGRPSAFEDGRTDARESVRSAYGGAHPLDFLLVMPKPIAASRLRTFGVVCADD